MPNFSILRESSSSHVESIIAAQYAATKDVPIKTIAIEALEDHANALREGKTLPIGSVAFVRKAMMLAGIKEPENLSYPEVLRPFLRRYVRLRPAGGVNGHWFIKPTATKAFTGFVFDTMASPDSLSEYDRAQYEEFMRLTPDTPVWISVPVNWLSEYRYYVMNGKVIGNGRYDDGSEDAPVPDFAIVKAMAELVAASPNSPIAFSLDVGVMESGETALVECNDAWALGYYRGSFSRYEYVVMLLARWQQLDRG